MDNKKLKEFCHSIGIKCVGIAGIGPYHNLEKIIKNKLANGHFTGMEEAIVENRIDPRKTMENVKSIIVCAFPYYIGENERSNLSKYCQVKDYHIVVKEYLQKICNHIESSVENFEYKIFADNGPLVDRHLAYLAGIGYFGINNNIITDEYGSYIFIGYIMSNYEFKTDEPLPRTCIKCGKCVKYCPGNALLGNYEMNPRRCLSYMTQKKGELSEEEIKLINKNKKVFGCDICQEVCPHNKKVPITNLEEFREDVIDELDYEEINSISNKEFKRRYSDRAFNWRGRPLIKRNMEIILEKPIE
ncbi:tRNA epoxyqueuosine(34) reductase QueG [Romboutsia weinsteinii]|uniref:tRNA epoxyqueuosine(34) reductase QueG n=1 Tax=Romboutsia weinsteinii TaxID=2020949 RepID=A0A371IZW9_9FIRM|nr:tRNA epoxyqueuosine(34) reductase QueG [Romboutsia weinsteinii]RDY26059.1 tRNA epoxyqueuosine(34) reductase QueG [Romboutsia weinsteinii]